MSDIDQRDPALEGELENVLGQVSRQLRGALGGLYGALSRIAPPQARDENGKLDQNAAILCQSYYRILRLTNNLSDAANLDGPSRAVLENRDIIRLCRDIVRRAEVPAELLGIHLQFRCDRARGVIIAVDEKRLERLIMNLLSNAFKFTTGDRREVTVEVRITPNRINVLVSDTGCGIPADQLETVFARYRSDRRQDPPPHGLGLGLPICRRIAQEHDGTLLLDSRVGEGTTVTLSLPRRRSQRQELHTPLDLSGGFNHTLLELADALPREAFTQKYLD